MEITRELVASLSCGMVALSTKEKMPTYWGLYLNGIPLFCTKWGIYVSEESARRGATVIARDVFQYASYLSSGHRMDKHDFDWSPILNAKDKSTEIEDYQEVVDYMLEQGILVIKPIN